MVALYSRVSTAEQAREGYSIGEQIDRLKKYCEAMGWMDYKTYTDGGYSGGNTERPALQELIEDVKGGKVTRVIVYKLDRLSRSQKDTLELIEDIFLANNADFISVSENFDTSTPFGKAMIGILAVFAQLEREQIKERMFLGKEGRAKEGKWLGVGYAPIGYDYINGELKVNEYEALQIRELHELYQKGLNFADIQRVFESKGYSHKYGAWTFYRAREVLLNDLYIGNTKFAKKSYKGIHEAIIDEDTYNTSVSMYQAQYTPKHRPSTSILGGLVWCSRCGARYGMYTNHVQGKEYRYYSCYSRRKCNSMMVKDRSCRNKIYNLNKLDAMILDEIRGLALNPKGLEDIRKADKSYDKERIIQSKIDKLTKQKLRLMDLYTLGEFTVDEIQAKAAPINEQLDKLNAELATLSSRSAMSVSDAHKVIATIGDVIDTGNSVAIHALVKALISRIDIDGENINIHWRFV